MKSRRPEACLSDLVLDERLAGELGAAAQAAADGHLAECDRCRARRDAMAREHAAFLEQAPGLHAHAHAHTRGVALRAVPPLDAAHEPTSTDEAESDRTAPPAARSLLRIRALGYLAALATAAGVLMTWTAPGLEPPVLGTRSKGAPRLGFFVSREGEVERGVQGQTVHPRDRVRFVYSADRPLFLAVLDRDERSASVFFPDGPQARRVAAGSDVALDFSVELDAQLGRERVHGVFCPEPFQVEPLRAALAAGRALPLAEGCSVSVIALHKAPRP